MDVVEIYHHLLSVHSPSNMICLPTSTLLHLPDKGPSPPLTNTTQNLAQDNNFYSFNAPPSRIHPEIHAVDSYQNVLFSLLHFRLATGVYPQQISVVTHEFKRQRFMEWHFPALGLRPVLRSFTSAGVDDRGRAAKVRVIGINPPEEIAPLEGLIVGEEKSGIGLWRDDPYGVLGELAAKRKKRGWEHGMERGVFVGVGLEGVAEELVCWDRGSWFGELERLPWFGWFCS